jgi:starch synthase
MPEIVVNGVTGLVVPPNDVPALTAALETLHRDPVRTRGMGRASRERVVNSFTWDRVVERCLDAYESALRN